MRSSMASGDPLRVWFPEMLDALASTWSPSMSWEELADFCRVMTGRRAAIRAARGIEAPRFWCDRCEKVSRHDIAGVTIRSALFALKKVGKLDADQLAALDRAWRKYRAAHRLDSLGRPQAAAEDAGSGHPCVR